MHSRLLESRYEILKPLSDDGFEADFLVRHRQLGETCRVKIRPHGLEDPTRRAFFDRHLPWFTRLKHSGILPVYDVHVDDPTWAVLEMKGAKGPTLDTLMVDASFQRTGAALPVPTALQLADQALEAVAYLHGEGWAHGSLAPDRFLLTRDSAEAEPYLQLADPGFARLVGASERTTAGGLLMHKLRYSPPEQFLGEATDATVGGDIYILGLLLYELLTGRYPVAGDHPTSLAAGHLLRPILPFNESDAEGRIPAGVRRAVERCLAKKPEERFADVVGLRKALSEALPPSPATEKQVIDLWLEDEAPTPGSAATADFSTRDLTELERRAKSRHLLDQAKVALASEDHGAARRLLREAQSIAPDDPQVARLLREVEKAARERQLQEERNRQVLKVKAEVEDVLAAGDWRSARGIVVSAVERLGGGPRLRELRQKIDEAERRDLETQPQASLGTSSALHVNDLVERARQLSQTEDLERAQEALGQALELDPTHAAARTLSESVQALMALRQGEHQRQENLLQTTQSIRQLLEKNDPGAAMAQLQKAVARHGDRRDLQELRYQIAEAFLNADLGREPLPPSPSLPPVPSRSPGRPPHGRAQPLDHVKPPSPMAEASRPAADDLLEGPFDAQDMSVDELPLMGSGPMKPPDELIPQPSVALSREHAVPHWRWWLLIALLMVLVAMLGNWLASRGSDRPQKEPNPPVATEDVRLRVEAEGPGSSTFR